MSTACPCRWYAPSETRGDKGRATDAICCHRCAELGTTVSRTKPPGKRGASGEVSTLLSTSNRLGLWDTCGSRSCHIGPAITVSNPEPVDPQRVGLTRCHTTGASRSRWLTSISADQPHGGNSKPVSPSETTLTAVNAAGSRNRRTNALTSANDSSAARSATPSKNPSGRPWRRS